MAKYVDLANNNVVGDAISVTTTVKDVDGNVINISSSTSYMTIKRFHGQTDANALSHVTGSLVTDGSDGKVSFTIPSSDTINAQAGILYDYNIQTILSGGTPYTVNIGKVVFVKEFTLTNS